MTEELKNQLSWRDLARAMKPLAVERGEWAGYPMPLTGMQLVLEPRFPLKQGLESFGKTPEEAKYEEALVNTFFSTKLRCWVHVMRNPDGRSRAALSLANPLEMLLNTLGAVDAWLPEAEGAAVQKLAELVQHRQFMQYMMTGTFAEQSKRSGVHYVFRRLRPTVAIRAENDRCRILCSLCLHPVGYYADTWAGCQTPTDDVISHLLMMRGCESKFWANANQHPAHLPNGGI
ncbi:MAG: hypothetical protein KGL39_02820 [Patescibacteria group bacterium]|nr:hypothetical protein [Patescibacteria group bacterium]